MSVAPMSLRVLLDGLVEAPDFAIGELVLDSRAVRRGDAFVALRGSVRHGIEFAPQAVAAGAAVVIAEAPAELPVLDVPVVTMPLLRARLGEIARRRYGDASRRICLIGVTGTNGKTSTVQLLTQALSRAGHVVGSIGTLGTGLHGEMIAAERTTPDVLSTHRTLAELRARGATHVAMEVSSHALDQGRVDGLAFDLGVFTNLTRDHLDYHGTMQAYGQAKSRLFHWPGLGAAVLNFDDPFGRELANGLPREVRVCGYSADGAPDTHLRAEKVATSAAGIAFQMHTAGQSVAVRSPLLGRFNVSNLLAVAGSLRELGWGLNRVAAALATLTPIPGRMNRLGGDARLPLVVVDYAHTPDALQQALTALRAHTQGRLICVFGCGGDRDGGKRPQMGAIAERLADIAIITDDNPRSEDGDTIVAQIRAGLSQPALVQVQRDRALAIAGAIALAAPGDAVLIAGKGHETYQEIGALKLPFDDLDQARNALEHAA